MPSTYSPRLRLELVGAGEQSGLWGDTTNKNFGTLVEQAIAGVAVIPLVSPGVYIVQALDGTSDEARCAVLKFTGSPGGAVTAQIPSTTKLYVVRNDTSPGQTITVRTAAQVANPLLGGVVLNAGEATLVFSDGTLAIAGIATAGVGPTTVANGGTGATSFTGGFVKSPGGTSTLTSSATVNLATEVSGVLPAVNGGTGGLLPTTAGGTGTNLAPSAGQVLIGTSSGTYSPAFLTQGTGITITPSSGGITISASGAASGVTSVTGSGNITASPTVGNVNISMTSAPTFASYVTSPTYYVGSSPGNMYIQNNGGEMAFVVGGLQTAKVTSAGIGASGLGCSSSGAGNQVITVQGTGAATGYNSGMAPASYQCGAGGFGLTYTPGGSRLDILGGALSAYFSGSSGVQGNNSPNWTTVSDQNLKTNLRPINNALNKLSALNPCHFEYKDELGKTRSGFIAQEFETVFPGHVTEMGVADNYKEFLPEGQEKIKALDLNLLPYLVKAIQELKFELDAANAEIAALKAK